jgi:hypothetical protein
MPPAGPRTRCRAPQGTGGSAASIFDPLVNKSASCAERPEAGNEELASTGGTSMGSVVAAAAARKIASID